MFRLGAAPKEIRKRFSIIVKTLAMHITDVIFKSVDGETTMNKLFTKVFNKLLDGIIHKCSFRDVINATIEYSHY